MPSRPVILGLVVLYVVSLLINLGIVPLYLEETRRSFITLEMLFRGDWLVPTELGELYCRKPPLFNWVMIPFFKLFGYSEWAPRMITVLSLLGMGALNWWFVRRHASRELAFWSTALLLLGGDIYFYFSTMGEIDIFYSLVTYASIVSVFHFGRAGKPWTMFFVVYALSAIGFLTKGLPSILFPVITIGAWHLMQRRWKSLLGMPHLMGIALFVLITGSYFLAYSQRAPLDGYVRDLWSQSSQRTVVDKGFAPLAGHVIRFTFRTLINILPASLLLLFLFRRGIATAIRRDPFLYFCAIALLANAAVYWLSPGGKSRYIYMLFPLFSILLTWGWLDQADERKRLHAILRWLIAGVLCVAGIALLMAPWLERTALLRPFTVIVVTTGVVLLLCGMLAARRAGRAMITLVFALVFVRIGFDLVVLPLRASTGELPQEKQVALEITRITGDRRLHLFNIGGEGGISFTTVFYLERDRGRVLDKAWPGEENGDDLYIARRASLDGRRFETLHSWSWKQTPFVLVRFTDRS